MKDKILLILDQLRDHHWHGECCHDCDDMVDELVKMFNEEFKKVFDDVDIAERRLKQNTLSEVSGNSSHK